MAWIVEDGVARWHKDYTDMTTGQTVAVYIDGVKDEDSELTLPSDMTIIMDGSGS